MANTKPLIDCKSPHGRLQGRGERCEICLAATLDQAALA